MVLEQLFLLTTDHTFFKKCISLCRQRYSLTYSMHAECIHWVYQRLWKGLERKTEVQIYDIESFQFKIIGWMKNRKQNIETHT